MYRKTLNEANSNCGTQCPSGTSLDCAPGEFCWIGLSLAPCQSETGETPYPIEKRCGKGYDDAKSKCGTPCASGTSMECDANEFCFQALGLTGCAAEIAAIKDARTGDVDEDGKSSLDVSKKRCGTTLEDANSKCGVLNSKF